MHWAYDLGVFGFSSGGVPVHLVSEMTMQLGGILALVALTPPLRQAFGQAMTYAWLAIGVLIAFVHPLVGVIILLGIPFAVLWLVRLSPNRGFWIVVGAISVAVVLVGIVVDLLWVAAHPGFTEQGTNLLLLPGPLIQLISWIIGLAGSGIALTRIRS